jgi:L-fucose mutarotase/ribose pyranase (RbsD/FucU family)
MKKSISIILALLMLVSLFTVITVSAEKAESPKYEGTVGDCDYAFYESSRKLVIKNGTNIAPEINPENYNTIYPWDNWDEKYDIECVYIEDGIKTIGENAFGFLYGLEHVYLPDSLETIGEHAFEDCENLLGITLPKNLKTIGDFAFTMSPLGGSVIVPKSVTYIGQSAFGNCTSLSQVILPDGLKASIEMYAFEGCPLRYVYIPSEVKSIGERAFGFYYDKSNIYLPMSDFTVYAAKNSIGDQYAKDNNFSTLYSKLIQCVDITGVPKFAAGDKAEFSCDTDERYTLEFAEWFNETDELSFKAGEEFVLGKTYSFTVKLTAADGYEFAYVNNADVSVVSTVDARVNESDEYAFKWEGEDAAKEIYVEYRFLIDSKTIKNAKVTGIKAKTYSGKAQTQVITVKDGTKTLNSGKDYTVSYKNNKNAGTATMTITGKGDYEGSIKKAFKINKAANPMTLGYKKSATAKAKAKTTIKKAVVVSKAQGKVTYKTNNKKITVKSGNLIISKGLKKGKAYKVKITITAKGNSNFKSKKITKTIKIKVK